MKFLMKMMKIFMILNLIQKIFLMKLHNNKKIKNNK